MTFLHQTKSLSYLFLQRVFIFKALCLLKLMKKNFGKHFIQKKIIWRIIQIFKFIDKMNSFWCAWWQKKVEKHCSFLETYVFKIVQIC